MLKKNIEARRIRRQESKQEKNFKEGIINALKLEIYNKNNIIAYMLPGSNVNATKEQKLVNECQERYPNYSVDCLAVKDKNGNVLFMVTKIYIFSKKRKALYEFDFGSKAPSFYFQPDEKTRKELYEMLSQEENIRDRQGNMIEDKKAQKAILDWLTQKKY